jgi:hypothetical protein
MSLANGPPQALGRPGKRNQMSVIRHQTIGPDGDATGVAPMSHQLQIALVIFVAEEGLLPAIAALRNMMRQSRDDDPR